MLPVAADYCCLMNSPQVSKYSHMRPLHWHLLAQPAIISCFLMVAALSPEDGGSPFLQNVGKILPYYGALVSLLRGEGLDSQEPQSDAKRHCRDAVTKGAGGSNTQYSTTHQLSRKLHLTMVHVNKL
jgi:hypothetical protein